MGVTYTFQEGTIIRPVEVNKNFEDLASGEGLDDGAVIPVKTGSFSHVYAISDSGQVIQHNVWTAYLFEDEIYDTLGEYNPATGIFTAIEAGYYFVRACLVLTGTTTWAAGEELSLKVVYQDSDEVIYLSRETEHTATSKYAMTKGSCVVYLAAGESLHIEISQRSGAALAMHTDPTMNTLNIDRLPN